MDQVIAFTKPLMDQLLSLTMFLPLLGVLIGAYLTYKFTIDRDRMMAANDAYKTVYGAFFIKLSAIKINIELKKKEYGERNFRKLNKQCKKRGNMTFTAKLILDASDDLYNMVKKHDQDKLSMTVIARYFAVEQMKEQLRILELSILAGEEKQLRESKIALLQNELAQAKIAFVQGIIEDIQKLLKSAKSKDSKTKKQIKFLLKLCKTVKKNGLSKRNGYETSHHVKVVDQQAG